MKLLTSVTGFFSRHHGRGLSAAGSPRQVPPALRRKPKFETLENRILLSVDLIGIPDWIELGPAPTTGGQTSSSPDDAVSGAVNALAAHPTNPDILFAGGAGGGVWRTTNATSASPNWQPLTDQYRTLAISDLAFSPLDGSNNTLFAGTGGFTSGGPNGAALGLLRTTDGGDTWEPLAEGVFTNLRIRSVVPTAIGTSLVDQVVLAAAIDGGGVYRSTDGGEFFTPVSGTSGSSDGLDNDADGTVDELGELNLPGGSASYLVADPGNINRFYAAIPGQGIFRSDNGGANWIEVNNGLSGIGAANVELSVSAAAGNPVYAAFVNGGVLANVFRSADQGGNWTAIGAAPAIHPGGQGFTHFSILADRADPDVVYVGGDRQAASPFVGNLFRGDASGGTWTDITDVLTTGFTAPHADSRDMVYDANGNIVEADDGGIFRLTNPPGPLSIWTNLNRNLGVGEFYGAPYDHVRDVAFGGTQDTGSAVQSGPGSLTWDEINQGDGGSADVGYVSFLGVDFSVEYTMGNNFGTFQRHFSAFPLTVLDGQLGLGGLDAADSGFTGFSVFAYEVNAFSGAQLVIGGINSLYESTDFGDNLTNITPAGASGVSALAYGGSQGGVANPDVIYAGIGGNLYLRTTSGGAFSQLGAYAGGTPLDIALDPDDWNSVYVTDGAAVYHSGNGGTNWTSVNSAGLSALTGGLNTVEVFSPGATPGDEVLLVGGANGAFRTRDPGDGATARWTELGWNLPNAPVADLQYDSTDDILVASAFGRGVWAVENAGTFLALAGVIEINGDTDFAGENDVIKLVRDANVPSLLEVFLNDLVNPARSVPFGAIERIDVDGLAGSDDLTLDFGFGDVIPVDGIDYDGGADGPDTLRLENGAFTTVTYTVTGPGDGTVDLDGDVVTFENLEPVVDTSAATFRVFTDATGAGQTIQVEDAGGGMTRIDDGGTSAFESVTFAPPASSLTVNAADGNDAIFVDFASGTDVVNVNGGPDTDSLQVNGTAAADSITITSTQVTRGAETVNYQQIEDLAVTGGDGEDDLIVLSTSTAGARLDAEEDSDDYSVNFGSLAGTVLVDDSGSLADTDTLLVNGTAGDDVLALAASSITRGAETVNYFGIEELTLDAGNGNDTITVNGTGADTTVLGGDGDDDFIVNANGPFTLTLDGGEGSDSYEINLGALIGPVVIDDTGTTGTDTLLVNGTPFDDVIILTDTSISGLGDGSPFDLTFSGIEVLAVDAKAGDDIVDGSALTISVTIYGGDGDDLLIGGSNDDQIFGQGDNDDLIGNLGADLLDGGEGSDGILGDMGTIVRELVAGGGVATLLTTQNGRLEAYVDRPGTIRRNVTLINADQGGDDTLIGGAGDDYLHGGAGDDALSGDEGIDALFGNDGDDTLAGGADDDHLYGGAGDDELDGNAGADIAYGGDGNDRLVADSSGDRLIDWFGNFNEFVVPGPGFGAPVIVRSPAPWVTEFLFVLAADDGALDADAELRVVIPGSSAQKSNSGKGG